MELGHNKLVADGRKLRVKYLLRNIGVLDQGGINGLGGTTSYWERYWRLS